MPSEKFSARLSIAARATPASSSASGSRPTMCDTAMRPASRLCSSPAATARHMGVEAALGEQRAGGERGDDIAERHRIEPGLDEQHRRADAEQQDDQRDGAVEAAGVGAGPCRGSCDRSSSVISRPIQVTGWPIKRYSQAG